MAAETWKIYAKPKQYIGKGTITLGTNMSEELTREQVELLCQQIGDLNYQASGDALLAHDAALRAKIEALEQDKQDMRHIAHRADILWTDREELKAQLAATTQERDEAERREKQWEVDYAADLKQIIAERDRLKEALRFYRDPQTYGISGGSVDRIIQDAGKRAQAALVAERDRLKEALGKERIDGARFERAPCYLCGYNGPSYFHLTVHACAARYHALRGETAPISLSTEGEP
jgi:hypothetical protein